MQIFVLKKKLKEGSLVLSLILSHCPASLGCFSSDFGHWISKGLEGGKTGLELHQLRQNLPLAYPVAKIGTNSQASWAECDEMNDKTRLPSLLHLRML